MTAAQILLLTWAAGTAILWIVALVLFLENVWRTRARLLDEIRGDALLLGFVFILGLIWPAVLIGGGSAYGLYRLARRGRPRAPASRWGAVKP